MELLLRSRWPNKVAVTAYADDIAVAMNADNRRELEELASQALEIVSHWAESQKTKYRDVPIDRIRQLKYLGVILDERLSFTEHVGYISNKARGIFQSLRKFALPRWGNCVDSLKKIYQVAIIPIVGYASEVWLHKLEFRHNKQRLRSLLCFCLRATPNRPRTQRKTGVLGTEENWENEGFRAQSHLEGIWILGRGCSASSGLASRSMADIMEQHVQRQILL
ncbi:hypothetical protein JTB14_005689 [Gonioctena quinquepunctata]|nr:hypothetical protein JTB14_005689 [Gonioctena quinquepunctata]